MRDLVNTILTQCRGFHLKHHGTNPYISREKGLQQVAGFLNKKSTRIFTENNGHLHKSVMICVALSGLFFETNLEVNCLLT